MSSEPSGSKDQPERSSEPIDAEFEPARPAKPKKADTQSTPSWSGVAAASVAAALAGGAIGVVSSGSDGKYATASEVAVDIERLRASDIDYETRLGQLRGDLTEAQSRLTSELQTIAQRSQVQEQQFTEIAADVTQLTNRLNSVLGLPAISPTVPTETNPAETDATDPALTDPNTDGTLPTEPDTTGPSDPGAGMSLMTLSDRLATLEDSLGDAANGVDTTELAEVRRQLDQLQERVSDLEARASDTVSALSTRGEALAELSTRLNTLSTRIDERTPSAETGTSATGPSLDPIPETDTSQFAQAALALSAIETASREGEPFLSAYARLQSSLPDDRNVDALASIARTGAPTIDQLQSEFDRVAQAVLATGSTEGAPRRSWMDEILSSIVTVRRSDGSASVNQEQTLSIARSALTKGDLDSVMSSLTELDPESRAPAEDFIEDIEKRQVLDRNLNALRLRLIGMEPN